MNFFTKLNTVFLLTFVVGTFSCQSTADLVRPASSEKKRVSVSELKAAMQTNSDFIKLKAIVSSNHDQAVHQRGLLKAADKALLSEITIRYKGLAPMELLKSLNSSDREAVERLLGIKKETNHVSKLITALRQDLETKFDFTTEDFIQALQPGMYDVESNGCANDASNYYHATYYTLVHEQGVSPSEAMAVAEIASEGFKQGCLEHGGQP